MRNKWTLAVAAGAFTTAFIGGVALAGFQPFAATDGPVIAGPTATLADKDQPKDKLKAALDGLVTKGTISQAQEDAVLQAIKDSAPVRPSFPPKPVRPIGPSPMSFVGDLAKAAADYLGMDPKTLLTQLHGGKSVADIANGLPGRNAQGAIDAITKAADARLDAAVTAKKVSADQAAALRPKIATEVAAFVNRSFPKALPPLPRPKAPAKPTPSPKS